MAINFKPFEELFASEYQLTYISIDGYIDVGPNTYSVFHNYTMTERQAMFQVCKKYLPWEATQEQEQWERIQYMYQFIIKSPAPFPYEEYPLSEEIIMAFTVEEERILKLMVAEVKARMKLNIANKVMAVEIQAEFSVIDTRIRAEHEPTITPLEADVKTAQDNLKAEFNHLEVELE